MHDFWYDHVKTKYGDKVKLSQVNADSSIVYLKTDHIYKGIAEDVGTKFDKWHYEIE